MPLPGRSSLSAQITGPPSASSAIRGSTAGSTGVSIPLCTTRIRSFGPSLAASLPSSAHTHTTRVARGESVRSISR